MTLFQIQHLSGRVMDVTRKQYKDFVRDRSCDGLPFRIRTSYVGRQVHKRCVLRPIEVTLKDLLKVM